MLLKYLRIILCFLLHFLLGYSWTGLPGLWFLTRSQPVVSNNSWIRSPLTRVLIMSQLNKAWMGSLEKNTAFCFVLFLSNSSSQELSFMVYLLALLPQLVSMSPVPYPPASLISFSASFLCTFLSSVIPKYYKPCALFPYLKTLGVSPRNIRAIIFGWSQDLWVQFSAVQVEERKTRVWICLHIFSMIGAQQGR